MNRFKFYVLLLLTVVCVPSLRAAGVSTNKMFVVGDNNVLPPNETNFFVINSNLLNASVGGGGGGGGVSSVNGLTGAVDGVLTNGETAAVVISNVLTLNSNLSGPGWSIVTNGPATATFASFGPNGGQGLYGSAGWANYALFPSLITLTGNGLTGNITASGSVTAAQFVGGGAGLTALTAAQLAVGRAINAANFNITNVAGIIWSNIATFTTNGYTNVSVLPTVYNFGANSTVISSNVFNAGNVLYWGADPTGVADSTPALVACANANPCVYVPSGLYSINQNSLILTNTNAVFFGDGNSTIIQARTFTANGILIQATNGVRLRNFQMIGNNSVAYATGASSPLTYGIQWNCDLNGGVENVTSSGFAIGFNVLGTNSILTRPQNGTITGCVISNSFNGIFLQSTNQAEYITIENNRVTHCYRALLNQSAANDIIIGNKFIDSDWAIYHNPVFSTITGDGGRGHTQYEDNICNHSVFGVAISGCEGVQFVGNSLQGSGCLSVTNSTNGMFIGNEFETTQAGLFMSGGSSNVFKHNNWLGPTSLTNIVGATTGPAGNSLWEGNLFLGAGGVALIGPNLNGFDFGGVFYAATGISSLATNRNLEYNTGTLGTTNTGPATEQFTAVATAATVVQFDNAGNPWSTNTTISGPMCIIVQCGGWFTNSGTILITGEHRL